MGRMYVLLYLLGMGERELILTQDGSHSLMSHTHGVPYHSKYGAVQESRHVFLTHGLFASIPGKSNLSLLEVGLGTGLNAFLTLLEAEKNRWKIDYLALEAYPVSPEEARDLNYPEILGAPERKSDFMALHECGWEEEVRLSDYFTFRKKQIRFEDFQSEPLFDLIYFDAFAPNAQPELWEEPVIRNMYKALKEGGVLTTYCAKGTFKRTAKAVGFRLESPPGPPGKREMTRGIKPG